MTAQNVTHRGMAAASRALLCCVLYQERKKTKKATQTLRASQLKCEALHERQVATKHNCIMFTCHSVCNTHMLIYMYTHTHTHTPTHTHTSTHTPTHTSTHTYTHIYTHTHTHIPYRNSQLQHELGGLQSQLKAAKKRLKEAVGVSQQTTLNPSLSAEREGSTSEMASLRAQVTAMQT